MSSPGRDLRKRRRMDFVDEAEYDEDIQADMPPDDMSDEDGEDLFGETMADDYKDLGELDEYDSALLDDKEYAAIDEDARREAERVMSQRDRQFGRDRNRLGAAGESDEEESDLPDGTTRHRRVQQVSEIEDPGLDEPFNLEDLDIHVPELVRQERPRAEIKRRFRLFLETFVNAEGNRIYLTLIDVMCARNGQSLDVSYLHLSNAYPSLALWLADYPKLMLPLYDEAARELVFHKIPDYWSIAPEIHVRIINLPLEDRLRDLRESHLNKLVKVSGVIIRRSAVIPQLRVVRHNCVKCDCLTPPILLSASSSNGAEAALKLGPCRDCQSEGPYRLNSEETLFRNCQRALLQESPGSVPAGRMPQSRIVILSADLVDSARPGEEVEVTGVYVHSFDGGANARSGFPVFSTLIEANSLQRRAEASLATLVTDEERFEIESLVRDPKLLRRIVKSISPSIYGNEHVKLGVALSMFGGVEKNVNNKHRIRGDVNVLVLGDPGTAKSQVLKFVEQTAPRCVFTTGKGASAVGLTASVAKDPISGEWVLEGGALVLADRGVCCIDEFDKMSDQDRTSIHEAMEQQSISISKAGIVTTLQARCAVIAAANPVGGKYDDSLSFSENVQLTDPILTRFDVLCVLLDKVDPVNDERLANFVVGSHMRSHPQAQAAEAAKGSDKSLAPSDDGLEDIVPIPTELLKKYIVLAREIKPSLSAIDQEKIARLYADLRHESSVSNGIPIAVRHIESIIRISESIARMRMSAAVSESDVNIAMRVTIESFITAQKSAVQKALRRQFARYLSVETNDITLLTIKLKELVQEKARLDSALRYGISKSDSMETVKVKVSELADRAKRHGVTDLSAFLQSDVLEKLGFYYDRENKVLIKDI